MKLQENISRIKQVMGFLNEELNHKSDLLDLAKKYDFKLFLPS